MRKLHLLLLLICSNSATAFAEGPWKLKLINKEEKIELHIDLHEESIEVPGMEMFGPMNGYFGGDIYRIWSITSYKIKDDKTARIKVSNDLGSETQEIELIKKNDSTFTMNFVGRNVIKRVRGRKLVKIPSSFIMKTAQ